MDPHRISKVELDEATILWRNPDVEQERQVAMQDLVEENQFKPLRAMEQGHVGPWSLSLSVHEGRLIMGIRDGAGQDAGSIMLGLARFRRPVREYFAICESYYKAIRKASAEEIETVDMARRAVHDQATRLLMETLEEKVETDFPTSRRLFTLLCVLHIRG
ncbi:UPF0262 family protein [Altericroceibacterium endophyticum]|uniref:UPF0262 family protein n=1 Tax=Altericroceibacterium endophyticum TaxID=1808508 RepID=A0A6I4T4P6_9SPHN|nr:UPF0262 family protein [Altericroceibacterium endophyticum]MXO65121.1 UPF0262 family protein [Altericroceibacterium endophyticum]